MSHPLCIIVGAGDGLGQSLARRFALENHNLALVSRTESGSQLAMDAARAANGGINITHHKADVTHPETVETAISGIVDNHGPPDQLIYNVCDGFDGCDPLDISYKQFEQVLRREVVGAFAAAKAVIPSMRERGKGCILFSSATAALRGSATHTLYAIGKFGLRALSQSLAKAYSSDGVHVVHVRLDCDLDVPRMRKIYQDANRDSNLADPDAVAKSYWWVSQQPPEAWSNEVELRPNTERWTY
ncbi:MAG: SDR family NAD(P)-dependent oxidoreductase [Pseudomonadota bacterium]